MPARRREPRDGATTTYRGALPGVDVAYAVGADRVKESLVLTGPTSPTSVTFDVTVPSGVALTGDGSGGLQATAAGGAVLFRLPAPFMDDAAGAHSTAVAMTASPSASGATVTVTADQAWLAAPGRVWPVTVDPTVTLGGPYSDCYLASTSATTQCGASMSSVKVGWDGTTVNRALLNFPVTSSVPYDAVVTDAVLRLYQKGWTTANTITINAHAVNRSWTTGATWAKYDGTNAWTTAGGDYTATVAGAQLVGGFAQSYEWYPVAGVAAWVNGSVANNGVLLKSATETTSQVASFTSWESTDTVHWPALVVTWSPRIGPRSDHTLQDYRIDDRETLSVDLANGNAMLRTTDHTVAGTGLDLVIGRVFNSRRGFQGVATGLNWVVASGPDVRLSVDNRGVLYQSPGKIDGLFPPNGSGGWTAPPAFDAAVTFNSSTGVYTITESQSGRRRTFADQGTGYYLQTSDADRNGNTITYSYTSGQWTGITDTRGRTYTLTYTSGYLTKVTDNASGRFVQYGYDTQSPAWMTSYTDANGKVTGYGYDLHGNLNSITTPEGRVTTLTYDSSDRVTGVTRVTNLPTTGAGPTTGYSYAPGSASSPTTGKTTVTDPRSHTWEYVYNASDEVTSVKDPLLHSKARTYSPNGNVATLTDGVSQVTNLTYDSNNNLTKSAAPASGTGQTAAARSWAYVASGQPYLPSSTTDARGNCRSFRYDTLGNATDSYDGQTGACDMLTGGIHTSRVMQNAAGTLCSTGKPGEVCSTTDGRGNTTSYNYDSAGNLSGVTPPVPLQPTTVVPDATTSRVTSVTDGKGQKRTYSYDPLDRITQILFNGTTTCSSSATCTTFGYDGDGNLTSRTDASGTTTFGYDPLQRVTRKSLPDTSTACAGSSPAGMTYTYDLTSNLATACDVGGTTTYTYDNANRLTGLAEPTGTCTTPTSLCTSFTYDNADRRTKTTFPNGAIAGATLNTTYDNAGNILTMVGKDTAGTTLSSFTYTYKNGTADTDLRVRMDQADPVATASNFYGYDTNSRLCFAATVSGGSCASPPAGATRWTYDAAGNRTTRVAGATTTYYGYNNANELCFTATTSGGTCSTPPGGASTYSYDNNGNTTSAAGLTLNYNSQDQNTSVVNGATTTTMTYADLGQTERTSSGSTTFASSPLGLTIATTGTPAQRTYYLRDNHGNLIGQRLPDGTRRYYLLDGLGSIVTVINGTGLTVGHRYGYDAWGVKTTDTGTTANSWQYTGGYADASSGYTKLGMRYYNSVIGRWTQTDSVDRFEEWKYVANEPIDRVDPGGSFSLGYELTRDLTIFAATSIVCAGAVGAIPESAGVSIAVASYGCAAAGTALTTVTAHFD